MVTIAVKLFFHYIFKQQPLSFKQQTLDFHSSGNVCVYIYIYDYMCVYIYIYIYIHMYVYMYGTEERQHGRPHAAVELGNLLVGSR